MADRLLVDRRVEALRAVAEARVAGVRRAAVAPRASLPGFFQTGMLLWKRSGFDAQAWGQIFLGGNPKDFGDLGKGNGVALNPKLRNRQTDALFEAVLALESLDECYAFFEDALTVSELQSLAQRWAVATGLDAGRTYEDIAHSTGASSATISRVKRALSFGADGYRIVLDRLRQKKSDAT